MHTKNAQENDIQDCFIYPPGLSVLLYSIYIRFYHHSYIPFMDYKMFSESDFIGLKNYIYMFTKDELFWHSLKVTFIYVLVSIPLKLIAALIIALLLNMKLKFINFFQDGLLYSFNHGRQCCYCNTLESHVYEGRVYQQPLSLFSIPPVDWLGNPSVALYTLSSLVIWQFGSSMVLFLAGLKQIPAELYEAARVDGASTIKTFFLNNSAAVVSDYIFQPDYANYQCVSGVYRATGYNRKRRANEIDLLVCA